MGNCDPYSDPSEPWSSCNAKSTRSKEPTPLSNRGLFTPRRQRAARLLTRAQRTMQP